MFQQVSFYLRQIAGLKTFIAALLFYSFFGFYIMPHGAKMTAMIAGKPVQLFDLQFCYSPSQAMDILSNYNENARKFTATFSYLADTVYPVAYTFLYVMALAWVFKNIRNLPAMYRHIHLFPVLAAVADLMENAFVGAMMHSYPDISDSIVYTASFFTSAKWCLVAVQTIILLGGIVQLLVQRFSAK